MLYVHYSLQKWRPSYLTKAQHFSAHGNMFFFFSKIGIIEPGEENAFNSSQVCGGRTGGSGHKLEQEVEIGGSEKKISFLCKLCP